MHVKSESLGYFEVWIVSDIRAVGIFIRLVAGST